jgi:hypothetical protein
VVDDGSTDDTARVAERGPCRLVSIAPTGARGGDPDRDRGGERRVRGDHGRRRDLPGVGDRAARQALADHLVRGNRESSGENMPLVNRIGNWFFNKLFAIAHGLESGDHLSGLYGLRRDAFRKLELEARGFDIETEIGIRRRRAGCGSPSSRSPTCRGSGRRSSPWSDGLGSSAGARAAADLQAVGQLHSPGLLLMALSLGLSIALSIERGDQYSAQHQQLHRRGPRHPAGFQFVVFGVPPPSTGSRPVSHRRRRCSG